MKKWSCKSRYIRGEARMPAGSKPAADRALADKDSQNTLTPADLTAPR
jgi:hypothetical protein